MASALEMLAWAADSGGLVLRRGLALWGGLVVAGNGTGRASVTVEGGAGMEAVLAKVLLTNALSLLHLGTDRGVAFGNDPKVILDDRGETGQICTGSSIDNVGPPAVLLGGLNASSGGGWFSGTMGCRHGSAQGNG